jgi:IrrE N-terminal-like domain
MNNHLQALQDAAKGALRYRAHRGYAVDRPCDVYELIGESGTDFQFVDIPSLEGMYLQEGLIRRICVCGRRPGGRQRFTAAHELGHSVLGHGTMIDAEGELGEATASRPEEHAADVFARYLLMPPRAVHTGFRCRGSNPASPTPLQVYIVSSWLGVGYSTLVNHMALTLNLYGLRTRDALLKTSVKQLKRLAASVATTCDVWILDAMWAGCTIHAQLGDVVRGLSARPSAGNVLADCGSSTWVCNSVGEGLFAVNSAGPVRICVSRRDYIGFYKYRYLPE